MYNGMMSRGESELVIELEVVKLNDKWYRKGLNMKGDECWEMCEEMEEVYSKLRTVVKPKKEVIKIKKKELEVVKLRRRVP